LLVLMPKKQPAKPAASATQQASNTTPSQTASTSTATTPAPAADSKPQEVSSEVKNASESLVTGSELENSINNIVGMGFSRELVVAAMRAAFNNPARAVELLTSGFQIPTQSETHSTPAPAQTPSQPPQTPSQPAARPAPATGGGSGVFDGLKQHPQFPVLCMLAQQGGQEALRQILEYFAQVSPLLLQLIVQNQAEFIQLLSTPVAQVGGDATPSSPPPSQATPPGVVRLTITPEDERAIMNIVSMGFDRNRVVEAYFLFEKDEAQTINYLLNNPDSDN